MATDEWRGMERLEQALAGADYWQTELDRLQGRTNGSPVAMLVEAVADLRALGADLQARADVLAKLLATVGPEEIEPVPAGRADAPIEVIEVTEANMKRMGASFVSGYWHVSDGDCRILHVRPGDKILRWADGYTEVDRGQR